MRKTRAAFRKQMQNRRFQKTEEKIISIFYVESTTTLIKIAKKAGIGRSTIYEHHHAIREVLSDYQNYLISEYNIFINRYLKSHASLKKLFFESLLFIMYHKKFFKLLLKSHDQTVLRHILTHLKPKILIYARLPKNSDKIFQIYTSEIIQLIERWGKTNFAEKSLESVLRDIVFLTSTCRSRLMPIND